MEEAARIFARRVLLVHLALLAAVIGLVFFASREVYDRTREQAMKQFESRQSLLASQTGRGIESFYKSIFDDLDLMRQAPSDDEDESETAPASAPAPTTRPVPRPGPRFDWRQLFASTGVNPNAPLVRTLMGQVLTRQLAGRVEHLFSVDRDKFAKHPGEREKFGVFQPLTAPDPRIRDIVHQNIDNFKAMEKPQISPFQLYDSGDGKVGMNLVCVPTSEKNPRILVAAVPIKIAQTRFIDKLNTDNDSTHAVLADETGTIMIGNRPTIVGRNVRELHDQRITQICENCRGRRAVEVMDSEFRLGGQHFPPSMVAIEPVSIAGKKWMLMVITPLADVDLIVSRVFKRAIFWAIFVVCSMTAILVSTSFQMIRSRIRMESVRTELLTRELTKAREIQLAWLPQQGVSIPSIDIAAVNHPASHISGDFYNWFELPDGRTVVTIGDVTGHGMSAAFLMATTQLLVHNTMLRIEDPGQTLQEVNRQLCTQVFNGQFVTMIICVIDVDAGTIEVATAGHYPPILGHEGSFRELPVEPQLVLGVEKDTRYGTERFEIPASASIVLYTDGVIDVRSPESKRFGVERLIDSLKNKSDSAQTLLDSVVGHINQFRGPTELPDDLTLVCIQTQTESSYRATQAMTG